MVFLRRFTSSLTLYQLGLAFLVAFACLYSRNLISLLLPCFTAYVIYVHGWKRKIPLYFPLPFLFLVLLTLTAGSSAFWAENPTATLKTFISLSLTLTFSFTLLTYLKEANARLISQAYTLILLSGLFLVFLIGSQFTLDSLHIDALNKHKGIPFLMKHTGSIMGLMAFVGCGFLWIKKNPFIALLTFFGLVCLIYQTKCETAFFGILLSSIVFLFSYVAPTWTTLSALLSTYTYLLLSPVIYTYLFTPQWFQSWTQHASFLERVFAWNFYSKKFFEKPFLGWGAESSKFLPTTQELPNLVIHPHNNSIQAFVELGILGGIFYALFCASLFWLITKHIKDRLSVAVCNSTLLFALINGGASESMWRNYWLSVLTLTAGFLILFLKARAAQQPVEDDHLWQGLSLQAE